MSALAAEFIDGPARGQVRKVLVEYPFLNHGDDGVYVRLARSHVRSGVIFYEWRPA